MKLGDSLKKCIFPDVTNVACTGYIAIRAYIAETGIGGAVGSGAQIIAASGCGRGSNHDSIGRAMETIMENGFDPGVVWCSHDTHAALCVESGSGTVSGERGIVNSEW